MNWAMAMAMAILDGIYSISIQLLFVITNPRIAGKVAFHGEKEGENVGKKK